MNKLGYFSLALLSLVGAGSAQAQTASVDLAPITADLAQMPVTAATIGAALALAAVVAVSWKWVKGALFG